MKHYLGIQVLIALCAGVVSMLCYTTLPSLAIALLTVMVCLVVLNQRWEVI